MSLLLLLAAPGVPGEALSADASADLTLADDAIAADAVRDGDTVATVHLADDAVVATSGSLVRASCAAGLLGDAIGARGHAGSRRRADPNAGTLG